MLGLFLQLWHTRNNAHHGSTNDEIKETPKKQLIQELTYLQHNKDDITGYDRDLVFTDRTTLDTLNLHQLSTFVSVANMIARVYQGKRAASGQLPHSIGHI